MKYFEPSVHGGIKQNGGHQGLVEGDRESVFLSMEFQFGEMKKSSGDGRSLNSVSVLIAAELYTEKWLKW